MKYRAIEEVALNSWPALQQILYDGWVLRFSKGYTKRANSINPVYDSTLKLEEKVEFCEKLYADKGLPPIFRLTSFASPPALDEYLGQRHYKIIDPSLVKYRELNQCSANPDPAFELYNEKLDHWMEIFCRFNGVTSPDKIQPHRDILQAIPTQRFLGVLTNSDVPVSCGIGVLSGKYFGIFDLVTDPELRKRGFGARLVSSMLCWAWENGATYAYLQVMRNNEVARHLYRKLGFKELYQYWYRVPA